MRKTFTTLAIYLVCFVPAVFAGSALARSFASSGSLLDLALRVAPLILAAWVAAKLEHYFAGRNPSA